MVKAVWFSGLKNVCIWGVLAASFVHVILPGVGLLIMDNLVLNCSSISAKPMNFFHKDSLFLSNSMLLSVLPLLYVIYMFYYVSWTLIIINN